MAEDYGGAGKTFSTCPNYNCPDGWGVQYSGFLDLLNHYETLANAGANFSGSYWAGSSWGNCSEYQYLRSSDASIQRKNNTVNKTDAHQIRCSFVMQ